MLRRMNTQNEAIFIPGNDPAYQRWRKQKLVQYEACVADPIVSIKNPTTLSPVESHALRQRCEKMNVVIYAMDPQLDMGESDVVALGQQLGLVRLDNNLYAQNDSISALEVSDAGRQSDYIPYTSRPLSWHTDGYYNAENEVIQGWSLHCVRNAKQGGCNQLLDHEIAYIQLRDEDPRYIQALMQDDVMTIPANIENGETIRPERTGPVFSLHKQSQHLHMRYSARARNIIWKDDDVTRDAVDRLNQILTRDSPFHLSHCLEPGQGVISNNVLHNRSEFHDPDDAPGRLIFRARYYDRVQAN